METNLLGHCTEPKAKYSLQNFSQVVIFDVEISDYGCCLESDTETAKGKHATAKYKTKPHGINR